MGECITHIHINWSCHDDVIEWKHFLRYWPFVRGIHRWPVDSPHKGQWRGILLFSLICAWTNGWANNIYAGDLRRHRAHYDINVMEPQRNKARQNRVHILRDVLCFIYCKHNETKQYRMTCWVIGRIVECFFLEWKFVTFYNNEALLSLTQRWSG